MHNHRQSNSLLLHVLSLFMQSTTCYYAKVVISFQSLLSVYIYKAVLSLVMNVNVIRQISSILQETVVNTSHRNLKKKKKAAAKQIF